MASKLNADQIERYSLVKPYVSNLAKEVSLALSTKLRFVIFKLDHKNNFYTYTEKENGIEKGRVTFRVVSGKVVIFSSYVLDCYRNEALKDFNYSDRVKVTRGEKHWKGAYS